MSVAPIRLATLRRRYGWLLARLLNGLPGRWGTPPLKCCFACIRATCRTSLGATVVRSRICCWPICRRRCWMKLVNSGSNVTTLDTTLSQRQDQFLHNLTLSLTAGLENPFGAELVALIGSG